MRDWRTETKELATGVFAYVQATGAFCVANAGLIAGPDGTTAIDALFTPVMTRTFLGEAARVAPRPITRLINTHHHIDHTLGNALFPRETQILSHRKAKVEMRRLGWTPQIEAIVLRMGPQFAGQLEGASARLPDATFDGAGLELTIANRRVQLLHFGPAHTVGDVLVLLPDQRILFAGDIAFFEVTPLAFEGHIGNWIRVADAVMSIGGIDTIVPGHGPVGTADDLRKMRDYLQLVRDGARQAFDAGAPEEDAVRAIDLGEFAAWGEPERVVPNVARLYREFRGELDGLLVK